MKSIYNLSWIFLLIAMAGDLIVSFIFSYFYKGYSNLKMSISALGNPKSPVRLPFNIWMLIEGLLFLIALPAIYNYFNPVSPKLTITLLIFIAVFANEGLWQRLNLIFMYLPLCFVCVQRIIFL